MLKLIPSVKQIEYLNGFLDKRSIKPFLGNISKNLRFLLEKLPTSHDGENLFITFKNTQQDSYTLNVLSEGIYIEAGSERGAFYAIQTLRQIFKHEQIPFVKIYDEPDFEYRGFYHDITRGKIASIDTLKRLIDNLAYYKYNSLQLYVEHVYPFSETLNIVEKTGCITPEELQELDKYCKQNYIDFIPSLATFGHLYELLTQEEYMHFNVLSKYSEMVNSWQARQIHHTIDPRKDGSFKIVQSLINQYASNFSSDYFNICCDETADLTAECGSAAGDLYVEFVNKIIEHTKGKGKKVMMWADILLQHPESIALIPEETIFLNWDYRANPIEENIAKFSAHSRKQILCPGTWTWNNFCERLSISVPNICKMAEYGYKYGAYGLLITNWGDFNNICSLELSSYGLMLGAEKSWNPNIEISEQFDEKVDFLLCDGKGCLDYIKRLSAIQEGISWFDFCCFYSEVKKLNIINQRFKLKEGFILEKQSWYREFINDLSKTNWDNYDFKQELIVSAQGMMMILDFNIKQFNLDIPKLINAQEWYNCYSKLWLKKNKPSELYRIKEIVDFIS
jgi:hypothetical protein